MLQNSNVIEKRSELLSGCNLEILQRMSNPLAVSIDVGLSVNAPNSAVWLEKDPGGFILGFEPLRSNIERIFARDTNWARSMNPSFIGSRFFLIPIALSEVDGIQSQSVFVTEGDPGCTSLHRPINLPVARNEEVTVSSLDFILQDPLFENIKLVKHLKIDTQGHDFQVLLGSSKTLQKTLAVTIEVDTLEYYGSRNDLKVISRFLGTRGFSRYKRSTDIRIKILRRLGYDIEVSTQDPTFINWGLLKSQKHTKLFVYQEG